jgi:hypothetical protein
MTAFVARGEGILDPFPQYINIPEGGLGLKRPAFRQGFQTPFTDNNPHLVGYQAYGLYFGRGCIS